MGNGKMWFGTVDNMRWVQCPNINIGMSSVGWVSTATYLNGGAAQRQSTGTHKEYSMSWGPTSMETIAPILQTLQTGQTIYFNDPIAAKSNILPSWRADPGLAVDSSFSVPDLLNLDALPTPITFAPSPFGYPTRGASYDLTSGASFHIDVFAPVFVPEGYTLHFGAHGNSTGDGTVGFYFAPEGESADFVLGDLMSRTTPELTNIAIPGPGRGALVFGGGGILNLSGLVAQVLPSNLPAPRGNFMPGLGHSGVKIASSPQLTGYSSAIEKASVGLSVDLIEVGAWPR